LNILGIDFEEWYHPELVSPYVTKEQRKPSMIKGLDKILDWLRVNDTYATFFVVGELIEHDATIVDKIISSGNEIGFHTMHHTRLDTIVHREKFRLELDRFAELTGGRSKGFRAPTFSLNKETSWVLDMLAEKNYLYDSSVVPAKTSLYGVPNAPIRPYKISSDNLEKNDPNGQIMEFPLLVTNFLGKKIPAGGGFYVRILPIGMIKRAIRSYQRDDIPATCYIHSWELTPEHFPRIPLPFKNKFITYHNLEYALPRMTQILKEFRFTSFERYLSHMSG
jgi:polysaccharide deacetylase family protein (PEP-CTERM system associated)